MNILSTICDKRQPTCKQPLKLKEPTSQEMRCPQLFLAKAFGFFNGKDEFLFQLFVASVWWQVQSVETARGQRINTGLFSHTPPLSITVAIIHLLYVYIVCGIYVWGFHHVCVLGSQVSRPTRSMQNFWGPLLPVEHGHMIITWQ